MSQVKTFLHDGTIGDVFASLPAIRECYNKTGKKALLYLTNGQAAIYYDGATHPTKNKDGVQVMLNEDMINMIAPLVKYQPYIEDCKIHNGEPIDVDMNMIRSTFINMPHGSLSRWYFLIYPDLACDLSLKCLDVPDTDIDYAKGKIIVARTDRYQHRPITYSFLKKYGNDIIFSGTVGEYNTFCKDWGLEIKRLKVNNFLELAQALKQCNGLISNQTMIFQIAELLKIPRAVELCSFAPNVIPVGEMAFDFYGQGALEYYAELFHKK